MNKQKIVVIGKTGQVAQGLLALNLGWTFLDRAQLDLEKTDQILVVLNQLKPDIIVNAAAYTKVDLAEDEKSLCQKINMDAVGCMAEWCAKAQAKLLHISTDYVFDGTKNTPYSETDKTSPVNYYGLSKLLSEQLIEKSGCSYTILRTSWVYSRIGHNFFNTMMKLIPTKNLNIVFDQVGTPTYAGDIAELISKIVKENFFPKKLYNFSGEGVASWYDFALMIKKIHLASVTNQITPIESYQYPQKAKRPSFSVLNKALIKSELPNLKIDHWIESLEKLIICKV